MKFQKKNKLAKGGKPLTARSARHGTATLFYDKVCATYSEGYTNRS